MYCRRTGLPTALASTAASIARIVGVVAAVGAGTGRARCTWTLSTGTPSVAATPCCTKCDFCVPLQQVTLPSLISTSAQAGPIAACDWNGHSYSASITLRGGLERLVDVAVLLLDLRLAHRRLADVVVERVLVGERRLDLRPFDLELLGGLDRVPFLRRDDAEEAVLVHHLRAGDVLDRALVDLDRHRARDRRTDHAAVHHARHLDVGARSPPARTPSARRPRA